MRAVITFCVLLLLSYVKSLPSNGIPECHTEFGEKGNCVNSDQCQEDDDIDLTALSVYRKIDCRSPQICCAFDRIKGPSTSTPSTQGPSTLRPSTLRPTPQGPSTQPPVTKGCGWSHPDLTQQGPTVDSADFGEFPWMVAVLNNGQYIGGGALIHPSIVLTSGHKIYNLTNNQITCRAGEWNRLTTDESYPHQDRSVAKIITHPDMNLRRGTNNIALLILSSHIDMSVPHIGAACLGQQMPQVSTDCFGMGWGKRHLESQDDVAVLKKIELPIIGKRTCEYYLQNTILGKKFTVHDSMVCAGGRKNVDTCRGDGGSPLVCPIQTESGNRYAVYGIVSFGVDCGQDNVPAVYTSVPSVYAWIKKTVADEGLDASEFTF